LFAAIAHDAGDRLGVVGVVDRSGGVGAEVEDLVTFAGELAGEVALHFVAGVVGGKSNFHRISTIRPRPASCRLTRRGCYTYRYAPYR
jgi:hypothetical protein